MDGAAAETVALRALEFLVSEEAALRGFMARSGATADDLRAGAGDPRFLVGILDFLLEDDERLLTFCNRIGATPARIQRAHAALSGAPAPT